MNPMHKTFLLLIVSVAALASDPAKVSDSTIVEYQNAVIAFQNAAHAQDAFWADIRKQYEAILAAKERAGQAAQAVMAKATKECGGNLDQEALKANQLQCAEKSKE